MDKERRMGRDIHQIWTFSCIGSLALSKSLLLQVHPSSVLKADEDGMLPNYAIYHELISTTRPYMRNVCAVEMRWVRPVLAKLDKLNVIKLRSNNLCRLQIC